MPVDGIQSFQQALPIAIFQQQVDRLAAVSGQPQLQQFQTGAGATAFAFRQLSQQMLRFLQFPTPLEFRRQKAGVFQNAVSNAQFFGNRRIIVQLQRSAFAGQITQLAPVHGLLNALFSNLLKKIHRGLQNRASLR